MHKPMADSTFLTSPSGADLIAGWIHSLMTTRRLSSRTLEAYRAAGAQFIQFITKHLGRPIDLKDIAALEMMDFRAYLAERRAQGLGNSALMKHVAVMRGFYRWLQSEHKVNSPILTQLRSPKVPKRTPRPISPDDVERLAAEVGADATHPWIALRDKAIVLLLYGSGLRIAEALGLQGAVWPLKETVRVKGKGSKVRDVPVLPVVVQAIETYLRASPYPVVKTESLFRGLEGGPLNPAVFTRALARARIRLGLPEHATPHALRHSFASHLLARGLDLRAIQELMGHVSLASTQVYTDIDAAHLLDVYRNAHPRA
jgi:integrase/recombinase XerC